MINIKLNNLVERLVYTFLLFVSYAVVAQPARPVVNPGGGAGAVGPGAVPKPENPIDMYEGALLMVALVMMVGYYLYTRNRKAIA